jgi:hypothetical protein
MDGVINDMSNNSSILVCTCGRRNVFTKPSPSSDGGGGGGIHIRAHRLLGGIMKFAIEMGSGAMIYIPIFIKIGSGIPKLIRGNTHSSKY